MRTVNLVSRYIVLTKEIMPHLARTSQFKDTQKMLVNHLGRNLVGRRFWLLCQYRWSINLIC